MDIAIITVGSKEVGKTCQITIGGSFTIYATNDFVDGCVAFCFEGGGNGGRKLTFEYVSKQSASQNSTASFIAQDEAKAWCLVGKAFAVVHCATASSAEYGDNTCFVAAQCMCSTEQVAGNDGAVCSCGLG